ncbi:MAG: VWA domain-containing protein, partial [Chloroflexota bacterium]
MSFANPNLLMTLVLILPFVWFIGFPRYRFRRRRDIASLIIRTLIMVLMVLGLAGIQIVRQVDRLAVVFLVDASDSIGTELREDQLAYIQNAVQDKPIDDEWAIIVFGANASIDTPFSNIEDVPLIQSNIVSSNTNISEAIQTGISLFPADARRRIVILSDGIETIGNAEAKARLAQASGVEISYVTFARGATSDVRVAEFTSPARVNEGQDFDINIAIESDTATSATLLVYSDNTLIIEEPVTLREGISNYTLTQTSDQTGFLNFSAQILVDGDGDTFTQNNTLGTFSQVVGQPRVLLVRDDENEVSNLVPALEGAGLQVDVIAPANLPPDTGALAVYQSVIIANVEARALTDRQQLRLQSYVRDLGGGLVFVGGPESYGPGGYFQTPLEAMLPVETQIRDQQRLPRLTIAYLVDSSGSMATMATDGIFTNLQLAQRAVNLSIDFLQPTDRAAVLTFDANGALVSPFQDVEEGTQLQTDVNSLSAGGGTDILAGLQTAERFMINEETDRRHLILITDGGAPPLQLVDTAESMNADYGITLSVIAIGNSQPPFLSQMATSAGGNYHAVTNAAEIPNILAQETVLATRSYIEEGVQSVNIVSNNPMTDGISAPPDLLGYVATTPRDTAQVVLTGPTPFSDPLLATWQYGLGRTVAFTSDATGRWAQNWIGWEDFSRFWGQVVNYSITENAGNNIETSVNMQDGIAQISVDARSEEGAFLNNLTLQASILGPDNTAESIVLQQTAPGEYQADFAPEIEGSYYLAINGGGIVNNEILSFNEITGWVMSYSPEYIQTAPNQALLTDLADITGGGNLADNPADTFITTQAPRTATAPIWQWMLISVLILLPIDIAIRRIIITRRDLRRFSMWVRGIDPNAAPEQRISSLMAARDRARARTGAGERDGSAITALRRTKERRAGESDTPANSTDVISPDTRTSPQPRRPRPVDSPPSDSLGTVGNLLKRRRTDDEDD